MKQSHTPGTWHKVTRLVVITCIMILAASSLHGQQWEIKTRIIDAGKRGSLAEKMFKLKRATMVRLEKMGDHGWSASVVAEKLSYPAGINRIGDTIYAGDAIQNCIHRYLVTDAGLVHLEPFLLEVDLPDRE